MSVLALDEDESEALVGLSRSYRGQVEVVERELFAGEELGVVGGDDFLEGCGEGLDGGVVGLYECAELLLAVPAVMVFAEKAVLAVRLVTLVSMAAS